MTTESPPRSRAQRRRDTEHRLTNDIDVWVASASADGEPYLVPLSFDWDGEALLLATPTGSPTGRNLAATRTVRVVARFRPVGLSVGVAINSASPSQSKDSGTRYGAPSADALATHTSISVPSRYSVSRRRRARERGGDSLATHWS